MQRNIKKAIVLTIGIIFLILGIIGLVLPILQGIFFLAIGLILVSLSIPKLRFIIKKHVERNKYASSIMNKAERWIVKFIGEV